MKSRGATGSPVNTTVVTPAALSRVITCDAVCWIVAGSSWYGITSTNGAPNACISAAYRSASSRDAALLSMYTSPNTRVWPVTASPPCTAGLPINCFSMNSRACSCFCTWAPSMAHTYGSRST